MSNLSLSPSEYFKNIVYDINNIYKDIPISKLNKNNLTEKFKNNNSNNIYNELNNNNYRCDNFIEKHNDKHILFSGDSYAFGCGMEIDDVWCNIIYKKISNKTKCSGYFNLGSIGSTTLTAISDIFKYCKKYGNPNIIFLCIPDPSKFYVYDNGIISDGIYEEKSLNILNIIQYQQYLMLDQYCYSNNIKLISICIADIDKKLSTVSVGDNIRKFDSFLSLNKQEADFFMNIFIKENNVEYYAKDKSHMGLAFHMYLANKMYEKYISITE